MGELRLFDEQHVFRAIARQMIGERCPDRSAADDENMDVAVRAETHAFTLSFLGSYKASR